MPFEEILPVTKASTNPASASDQAAASVRIAGRNQDTKILVISIGSRLLAKLGWAADQRVKVLFGTGTDAGKVRLSPSDGGHQIRSGKRYGKGLAQIWVNAKIGDRGYLGSAPAHATLVSREIMSPGAGAKGDLYLTLPQSWLAKEERFRGIA